MCPRNVRAILPNKRLNSLRKMASLFLHTQGYGEQPTHAGIDPVECAQSEQRPPRPDFRPVHGKQKESEEASPPSKCTWPAIDRVTLYNKINKYQFRHEGAKQ